MDIFPTVLRQASIDPSEFEFTRGGEKNDLGKVYSVGWCRMCLAKHTIRLAVF